MVYAKSNSNLKSGKLYIAGDLSSDEEVRQGDQTKSTNMQVVPRRQQKPTYKPIKAEKNLMSAYSIKPQAKKDIIFDKKIINAKYTISKKADKKLNDYQTNSPGGHTEKLMQ